MNIEETRRSKAARCRVDLRQMFDKGRCRLKFGGCIRYTKSGIQKKMVLIVTLCTGMTMLTAC